MSCAFEPLVDRSFSGRLGVTREHALREHVLGCALCTARYHRHLALSEVLGGSSAKERLARGLGLRDSSPLRWPAFAAAAVVALGVALVVRTPAVDDGLTARGQGKPGREHLLQVMELVDGGARAPGETVAPDVELAFAYSNPKGYHGLFVYGVDEHDHVYWFYPAWLSAEADPAAFPVHASQGLVELPDAVRHALDGRRLEVHALLTDQPLTVRQLEAERARGAAPEGEEDVVILRVRP